MKIIFDNEEQKEYFKRKICPYKAIKGGNGDCNLVNMDCEMCCSTCDIEMEVKDE